jgi:hypothetical protein
VLAGHESPLAQSIELLHGSPSAQRAAHGPAQSTPLSPWFRMPSEQLAAAQRPLEQCPEAQSESALHRALAGVSSARGSSQPGSSDEELQLGDCWPSPGCGSTSSAGSAASAGRAAVPSVAAGSTAEVPASGAGRSSTFGGS